MLPLDIAEQVVNTHVRRRGCFWATQSRVTMKIPWRHLDRYGGPNEWMEIVLFLPPETYPHIYDAMLRRAHQCVQDKNLQFEVTKVINVHLRYKCLLHGTRFLPGLAAQLEGHHAEKTGLCSGNFRTWYEDEDSINNELYFAWYPSARWALPNR